MKICVAQLNPKIGDLNGNTKKILESLETAKSQGADLVLFPELTICGYAPNDLLYHEEFVQACEDKLEEIASETKGIAALVGLPRHNTGDGKPYFNSVAFLNDGKIEGYYDKRLLPTYDVFDERRYFEPGKEVVTWELKGQKIGVLICEDIWQHVGVFETKYKCDPVKDLIDKGVDLLLNLSASPYRFDKPDVRVDVCASAARTLNCPVVLCCQVGGNDELVFDGYSVAVDAKGALHQLGKPFEKDHFIVDFSTPTRTLTIDPLADLYQALVLGVGDYFYKQGFSKACLGLSGGIDSALVACIAVDALGPENVLGVSMPSRYSSEGSISDAKALADNLKIAFKEIPIETPFKDYLELLEPHFEGRSTDTTEENLQARIRGMILMAFSNKFGYLVLSTGNKSEMGLGYCTLYGDMCGGLSVIGDVLKTQVYDLCRWINRDREVIPRDTIEKPPSAELRPDQIDLDSLPDYSVVDTVMKGYVEDNLSPEQIIEKFNLDSSLVLDLVKRLHRAEYKRRQAPPLIRVSKKAFSVGRRFPIVQGWID